MDLTPESNNLYKNFKKNYYIYFLIFPGILLILDLLGFKMPTDAYFSAFSTIAQTLAALVAFIGMFVIFKFDKLKTETRNCIINIEDIYAIQLKPHETRYAPQTDYYELCNIEIIDPNEFIEKISRILSKLKLTPANYYPYELKSPISKLNHHINSIESNKKLHDTLLKKYDTSLTFGFIAITISIMFLSVGWIYHPEINFNIHSLKLFVLGFAIYFAFVSIYGLLLSLEMALGIVADEKLYF